MTTHNDGLPRVSVLMPVRNGMPWLRDALEGLSRQTLQDFEILALDDGSTDGTPELLASWPDPRLRVIPTGGVGVAAALTIGLDVTRAPLVARHDSDDVSLPERLEAQAAFLVERTDVGVVGCRADYIDADGGPVDNEWVRAIRREQDVAVTPAQVRELMPTTCCLTHGSVMARTGVLRAAGGYRPETAPAEDYDLWLRLLPRTPIAKLPERLYKCRVHDRQISDRAVELNLAQVLAAKFSYLRRLCPELPSPARLVVLGTGRSAAYYRALARVHGFLPVPAVQPLERAHLVLLGPRTVRRWSLDAGDVLVITDYDDLKAYDEALVTDISNRDVIRIGNFFVMRRWARHDASPAIAEKRPRSLRGESSIPGGRIVAATAAAESHVGKTCFIAATPASEDV